MTEQRIYILGYDEIVIMLGLLGIDGTIVKESQDILKEIKKLIADQTISILVIAFDLSDKIIDFIIDFKLNNRKPIIFYLEDIFKYQEGKTDVLLSKILDSIGNIVN